MDDEDDEDADVYWAEVALVMILVGAVLLVTGIVLVQLARP